MMILVCWSIRTDRADFSSCTPYERSERPSRLISCHSSCEKTVLRASSTRSSKGASSRSGLGRDERPTTLPSLSTVTRIRFGWPTLPVSKMTVPLSLRLMGAELVFLHSGAASEKPNFTPSVSLSLASRETDHPLSLTARTSAQYFVSSSISLCSRGAGGAGGAGGGAGAGGGQPGASGGF